MTSDEEKPTDGESPEAQQDVAGGQIADKMKETYRWWDNLATINAEDPLWLGVAKIGIRVVGILVLLALSPLIILGLALAFIAVA